MCMLNFFRLSYQVLVTDFVVTTDEFQSLTCDKARCINFIYLNVRILIYRYVRKQLEAEQAAIKWFDKKWYKMSQQVMYGNLFYFFPFGFFYRFIYVSVTFPKLSKFRFFIKKNSYKILRTLVKTIFV